jgi:hypothetical protein
LTVNRVSKDGSPWPSTAHSIEFKRQVAQEFLAGETLDGLAKRHDICRNLIQVWVQKCESRDFNEDAAAADLPVSRRSNGLSASRRWSKLLKGAVKNAPRPNSSRHIVTFAQYGRFLGNFCPTA